MSESQPQRRWNRITPDCLVLLLLVVECLLWLSNWLGCPAWHKGYAVLTSVALLGVAMLAMLLWFIFALLFRQRFQFNIRSLLVLVVAVAVPCSWLAVEMKKAREQKAAVATVETVAAMAVRIGGWGVSYDWQVDADGKRLPNLQPPEPEWLRKLLGGDFFATAVSANLSRPILTDGHYGEEAKITDADLESVKSLPDLRVLFLERAKITDAGLEPVRGMQHLTKLSLRSTNVMDAGLERLAGLSQLQVLRLSNTEVTNRGLARLRGLTRLEELRLDGTEIADSGLECLQAMPRLQLLFLGDTNVTDAGLAQLEGLIQLRYLELVHTRVTDEGVRKLRQALPNCRIGYLPVHH